MSKYVFFLKLSIIVLFYFKANAQGLQFDNNRFPGKNPCSREILKNSNQRNGKFIIDSTYNFLANTFGQDWFNHQQYKVTARDQWGNFLNATTFEYDTIGGFWFAHQQYEAAYFDSLTTSLWKAQVWDSKALKWRMSDSISYSTSGNPEVTWYKAWNPFTFRFWRGKKITYSYYNEKLVGRNIQKFDTLSGNWKANSRYTYSYNEDELLDSLLIMEWDTETNSWEKYSSIEYSYFESHLIESEITKLWAQGNQWEDSLKIEYDYYADNSKLKQKSRFYPGSNSGWEDFNRIMYSYDENLRLDTALTQNWDGTEWYNKSMNLYSYNAQGLRTEVFKRFWDTFGFWIDQSKDLYDYDGDGNLTKYIFKSWDYDNNVWVNYYKYVNYWSEFVPIGINEISDLSIQIFPNPTTGIIHLSLPENIKNGMAAIYSMDGKLIINQIIQGGATQLNLEALPMGKYMLSINIEGKVYSQIVIKN
jgi:hypothetical protein